MKMHVFVTAVALVGSVLATGHVMANEKAVKATAAHGDRVTVEFGLPGRRSSKPLVAGGGQTFNDCGDGLACPDMVLVPASKPGDVVGSPDDEPGRLKTEERHPISIPVFAIGRNEVRVAEYKACVDDGGCRHPEWDEPGGQHNIKTGTGITYKSIAKYLTGDDQPITGISWKDAEAYARWLSQKTGFRYRLPSEKQWEYAARAGSLTPYWWGDEPKRGGKVMACCDGCGSDRDLKGLFPVGSFEPNPWGLYNVHGNAWEWVADYFCEDYPDSPSDGSPRLKPSCPKQYDPEGLKVFRGGSCFWGPRQMRASMRLRNSPDLRNMTVGFRVARELK